MGNVTKMALSALVGLAFMGPARAADSNQVLVETNKERIQKVRPVRTAIALSRPAGRAAIAVGRAAGKGVVIAGKVARPVRRAAWLARAGVRGTGIAAKATIRGTKGVLRATKPFRHWRKW
jgi:hypothetical protein